MPLLIPFPLFHFAKQKISPGPRLPGPNLFQLQVTQLGYAFRASSTQPRVMLLSRNLLISHNPGTIWENSKNSRKLICLMSIKNLA